MAFSSFGPGAGEREGRALADGQGEADLRAGQRQALHNVRDSGVLRPFRFHEFEARGGCGEQAVNLDDRAAARRRRLDRGLFAGLDRDFEPARSLAPPGHDP